MHVAPVLLTELQPFNCKLIGNIWFYSTEFSFELICPFQKGFEMSLHLSGEFIMLSLKIPFI